MFRFHNENNTPIYGALIDIGSGNIGVAIVASYPDEKLPKLLYAQRSTIRVTEQTGDTENLRRIKESLLSICLTLSQEGGQALAAHAKRARISKLYVTCSSPWSYTVARNVHYESDEPFKISESIIEDLVQSAETEIINHVREQSHLEEGGFDIVESATVDMKVNDYHVHDPLNLQGLSLELSHIIGLIPTEIIQNLHEIQDKLFPNTELRAHTSMLVMYCVLREIFPEKSSLCIIDITTQATEFGIVENNLLAENTYIPIGSDSFLRDILTSTKKPVSDIQTMLYAYEDHTKPLPVEFKAFAEEYIETAVQAIKNIHERREMPVDIIMTAHQPYEMLFKHLLTRALKKEFGKDITIISIPPESTREITGDICDDEYIGLSARFFHKLHGCGE